MMMSDPNILHAVQDGNDKAIIQLIKGAGATRVTSTDIQGLKDLATMFNTLAQDKQEQENNEAEAKAKNENYIKDFSKNIDQVMQVDPRYRAIRTAGIAGSALLHGGAKVAENNGNALAQALLASRRHSDTQNEAYGQNYLDRTAAGVAHTTAARGANTSAILNALGDAVDKALGLEEQNEEQKKRMKLTPYMSEVGLPGTAWQTLGQNVKRAYNTYK